MNDKLQETLADLHEQLQQIKELEPDERVRLEEAIAEIKQSLDQSDIQSSDLAERFHRSTEKFADAHPLLTRAAGQVADMLSQMGI